MDNTGAVVDTVTGSNGLTRRYTLFGSVGNGIIVASDLLSDTIEGDAPFVVVEAKAIPLNAHIRYSEEYPYEIEVVVGLFSMIKLIRFVSLEVESRGFQIPKECDEVTPVDPCELFNGLDFPVDSFLPPQKNEFFSGVAGQIPPEALFAL